MQENTNIVEKLNNHLLPVDESYWAEMEERLQNDRKKGIPLWVWFAGTSIAASIALLFIVQTFNNDGTQMTRITQISADNINNNIVNEEIIEIQAVLTSADNTANKILNSQQQKNPRKPVLSVSSAFQEMAEITDNNKISNDSITKIKQNTVSEKQSELQPKHGDVLIASNEPQKRKIQKKKSWLIAAAFGSNRNLDFSNENSTSGNFDNSTSFDRFPEYGGTKNDSPSIDEVFQPFSEVTHSPPLSFGLTVRKNFNKHLAIETGLTYSFLQSKFKDDNEWQHRNATLKLHYIGIPLNLTTYLLNKPKWNIYFSMGGMVEKGIMLDYVQHTTYNYYNNQPVHTTSLQDHIPELQWSLNTSFGVDYKLYRDISIYFEPRITYYFKNNQPVSARTEMPLLVGLNAGLRFEF